MGTEKGENEIEQSYGLKDGQLHIFIQPICSCSKIGQIGDLQTAGVCLAHWQTVDFYCWAPRCDSQGFPLGNKHCLNTPLFWIQVQEEVQASAIPSQPGAFSVLSLPTLLTGGEKGIWCNSFSKRVWGPLPDAIWADFFHSWKYLNSALWNYMRQGFKQTHHS